MHATETTEMSNGTVNVSLKETENNGNLNTISIDLIICSMARHHKVRSLIPVNTSIPQTVGKVMFMVLPTTITTTITINILTMSFTDIFLMGPAPVKILTDHHPLERLHLMVYLGT